MQLSFRNPHQLSRLARSSAALPLSGTESPLRGLLLVVLLLSSSATTLKGQVAAAPTINLQPVSADLFKGQATTLTAAFSGNPGLAFQWYSGFAGDTSRPISGATSASYRAVARDKVERYWLRATNAAGIADSQAAIVTPWSERTKPPIVGRIFKVGSQLVSIARNYVQTSPDGRVWSPRDFVATDTFLGESNGYNFAIGAGRYVVAGERGVYESSNLTSWSRVVLPGLALFAYPSARAITFEGGRFWISAFQNIYSSSTGFTWIKNETGFTNFITRSIAHSGSRIVAIGTFLTGASNLEVPGIISSVDGISWIRCDLGIDIFNPPTIDRGTLNSVIFANGKFVVAASADNFYSSADGVSWIRSRVAGGGASNSIAFGNGMFVAGNEGSPYFATSTDGVNWTNRIAKLGLGFGSLSFVDGRFLAASPFDFLHASVDGINWTEISGAPSVVNSVTAGGGRYSIGAAYSDDGEVWHTAVTESMVPGSVGYLNGLFVSSSINNVGKIYTSTDANTWVQRNVVGATQGYSRFAYGNGTYVMLGTDSAATSTDGINWTARPIPVALLTTPFRGLAFGQGQFVAVGDGGHIATSTDGQNWTLREGRTTPPFDNFTSVAFGLGEVAPN